VSEIGTGKIRESIKTLSTFVSPVRKFKDFLSLHLGQTTPFVHLNFLRKVFAFLSLVNNLLKSKISNKL